MVEEDRKKNNNSFAANMAVGRVDYDVSRLCTFPFCLMSKFISMPRSSNYRARIRDQVFSRTTRVKARVSGFQRKKHGQLTPRLLHTATPKFLHIPHPTFLLLEPVLLHTVHITSSHSPPIPFPILYTP